MNSSFVRPGVAAAAFLGLLLVAQAVARPLSSAEQDFARRVQSALGRRARAVRPLTQRRLGARGVALRFSRFEVSRLWFPDRPSAERFAAGRGAAAQRQGREVVLVRGPGLEPALIERAQRAAWGAAERAPSEGAAERASTSEGAAERASSGGVAERAPSGGASPFGAAAAPAPEAHAPAGARARAAASARSSDPRREPRDLSGRYLTAGSGVLLLSERRAEPDGDVYRVSCEGFPGAAPRQLEGAFDGVGLALRPLPGGGRRVSSVARYLLQSDERFVRVGSARDLLPAGALAFWPESHER